MPANAALRCQSNKADRSSCADSEEKHEPASDIDTVVVDSLKVLDPERPIREADIEEVSPNVCFRG